MVCIMAKWGIAGHHFDKQREDVMNTKSVEEQTLTRKKEISDIHQVWLWRAHLPSVQSPTNCPAPLLEQKKSFIFYLWYFSVNTECYILIQHHWFSWHFLRLYICILSCQTYVLWYNQPKWPPKVWSQAQNTNSFSNLQGTNLCICEDLSCNCVSYRIKAPEGKAPFLCGFWGIKLYHIFQVQWTL